jgi:tetratricopeptide (TPR) repeat protein
VIGPLTDVLAQDRIAEPVVAVLIRALAATGQVAEALERYEAVRERLVADLGTEPGAELQAAYDLVRPTAKPARLVPAQLPVGIRGFAAREAELARLDAILAEGRESDDTVMVCVVSGTAGVGKTALAVHWAHRVADRFPDGQLYANLRGFDPAGTVLEPAEVVRGFLDALGVDPQRIPADLSAQAALYRSHLAGRRVLVLLDNVVDAGQVRPLLPGSPGSLVVVTSRNQLGGLVALDGANPLLLDVLSTEDSRRLLAHRLGAGRVAAEPAAVEAVIQRCAGLPLALAIVAARAAIRPEVPLADLAAQLGDVRDRLDTLSVGDEVADVRAVISWSYQALRPEAARLFRLLGLHPGPDITPAAAASLAAVTRAEASALAGELAQAHLSAEHLPGRYTFHDLLRAYAREQADSVDPPAERRAALHRMLDHYLHSAVDADRQISPNRDLVDLVPIQAGVVPETAPDAGRATSWFLAEHRVLVAAVERALAEGFDAHTWQLAWAMLPYLARRGHTLDFAATQRAAVEAATRIGDPDVRIGTHRNLSGAYTLLGRLDDARDQLERALALSAETDNPTLRAHIHIRLAHVLEVQGRHADALDHAGRSLELYRSAGHRLGEANALNAIGWNHALLGDYRQALTYCERALAGHRELGAEAPQAYTLDSIGYAYHHLGRHDEAVARFEEALALLRRLGDVYHQAGVLTHLGDTYAETGADAPARTAYGAALAILEDLDHPDAAQVRAKLARFSS